MYEISEANLAPNQFFICRIKNYLLVLTNFVRLYYNIKRTTHHVMSNNLIVELNVKINVKIGGI